MYYVAVQFCPCCMCQFYFPLFLGMVINDMGLRQKEIKFKPRIKLNNNILHTWGRKFVAPKVARAKGVEWGEGGRGIYS